MGVLIRQKVSTLLNGRPLPLAYEERAMYRWVLKIHGLPINNTHASCVAGNVLFLVRIESRPNINVERQVINGNYIPVRQNWTPLEVKIVDTISDVDAVEFLRGWMESDRKFDITLEKLDPVGVIQEKWQLHGSFIQEMNHEIVYDRTIGDITIRLNYDYANLIY